MRCSPCSEDEGHLPRCGIEKRFCHAERPVHKTGTGGRSTPPSHILRSNERSPPHIISATRQLSHLASHATSNAFYPSACAGTPAKSTDFGPPQLPPGGARTTAAAWSAFAYDRYLPRRQHSWDRPIKQSQADRAPANIGTNAFSTRRKAIMWLLKLPRLRGVSKLSTTHLATYDTAPALPRWNGWIKSHKFGRVFVVLETPTA